MHVEQVIYAAEYLDLVANGVVRGDVNYRIGRRQQPWDTEIAVHIDEAAGMKHRGGQCQRIDRIPDDVRAPFFLWPT